MKPLMVFVSAPSPLPRRHRLRMAHKPLACVFLQPFQHHIPRRLLPIPPAPAALDEFLIQAHAIGQDHVSKDTLVLVVAMGLEHDFLSEYKFRRGLLRSFTVGLAFLQSMPRGSGRKVALVGRWLLSAKCGSSAPRWHHHKAVLNTVALTFSISGGARRRPLHAVVRVRFRPLEQLVP
jgi:hypothetical protein